MLAYRHDDAVAKEGVEAGHYYYGIGCHKTKLIATQGGTI